MSICLKSNTSLVAESSTSEHDSVAQYAMEEKSVRASDFSKENLAIKKTVDQVRLGSPAGDEKLVEVLPKKDELKQQHKDSLEDSARMLQAMNKELDFGLAKHGKVQVAELAAMVRALNKEMETVEAVELDVSRESRWDIVKEGSSLRCLLESLKLKLETILRQKPELTDKKENTIKMIRGCAFEDVHAEVAKNGESWERVAEAGSVIGERNRVDLLRTKSCRDALNAADSRTSLRMTTLSEGTGAVCVSNCGSCAKIVVSGEEFESSKDMPNKLGEAEMAASMSQVSADPSESSFLDFSIRSFVSTARSKDIETNWPFSRRSLKLCLKRGVKNMLPPIRNVDSVQNNSAKQCLVAGAIFPAERSSLDVKPFWLKNHSAAGSFCDRSDQRSVLRCTESISSPSGIQDFASKITAHSLSEIESVSTSRVPLSEVSDRQGATVPPARQKTDGASMFAPNKKRKVAIKLGANVENGPAEEITSTCTVPLEAVAQKTCPVCGIFSSSSNTTLNAHIDQCLLVEPTSECMKNSKTARPRLKPRKIRLMSDILATAPCCTLRDLDIRNGRVSVADADWVSHANKLSPGKSEKESLRHVKDNGEDSAVYIDANGTKIRILSKTNDASSIRKCAKELRVKKLLKKGKRSKFMSSNKKHLGKNPKLSKANVTKACLGGQVNFTEEKKHQEEDLPPSFKFLEQNKVIDSGNCLERTVFSVNNHCKRKRGRPKGKARATNNVSADIHQSCFASSNLRTDILKPHTVQTGIDSVRKSMDQSTSSRKVVIDEKGQFPHRRKSMTSSPLADRPVSRKGSKLDTISNQFTREDSCAPEASEDTQIHSSMDNEVGIHADVAEKNDLFSHDNENLSTGILHDPNNEVTRLPTLGKSMLQSGEMPVVTSTNSRVEKSCVHSTDEAAVALTAEMEGQFNSTGADADHQNDKNELIGSGASAELPTGEEVVASFSKSSDPELHTLTGSYGSESSLLQFAGSFFGSEPSVHVSQPCLGDTCQPFYAIEGGIDVVYPNSEDIEQESSIPLVESIPIPGPPGSYLPSFRDFCFENTQTSQNAPDIDKVNLESPSGAATISGTTLANADFGAFENPAPHVVLRPLGERTGTPTVNAIITSVMAGDEGEKLGKGKEPSILNDEFQPCFCSRKEGVAWNSALNAQESRLLRPRMMTTTVEAEPDPETHICPKLKRKVSNMETKTGESSLGSSIKEVYENSSYSYVLSPFNSTVQMSSSPSDCNSRVLSPPPPVFRLMGKDVMVLNNGESPSTKPQP